MLKRTVVFLCGVGAMLIAIHGLAADPFTIAPPASWVDIQKDVPVAGPAAAHTDENTRVILVDDQVNVAQSEHYHRMIKEVLTASGVQDEGQVNLDFDPSYQQLTIHDVFIRRGTNILERLDKDKIRVIQQERDLDMNIYNGEVSAVLFLEDLRVGDRIEYSYTVRGDNPIFGGRYIHDFYIQWSVPVGYERFRLLWPAGRALGIRNHGTAIAPVIHENGAVKEYLWELHDVAAVSEEDSLPDWYNPYAWVQFSEFSSWKEVSDWAVPLYPRPTDLGADLREKIAGWQQQYPQAEGRIAAALAFVQDEIRYLGIEVGPNSHQPNRPGLVASRRFGDCKDKAYLFCSILQAMDIDACEVLVGTDTRRTIGDWLPSPFAFNHVVARVEADGRVYWLDPTESHQGGPLNDRYFPDYSYCLLVRPGTTALTAIPRQRGGWPKIVIQETFAVHGRKDAAELTVTTRAEGEEADWLRESIADQRRAELQKNYLNFYANFYPKIKSAGALEVTDHREQNLVEIVEHYRIEEFWTLSDDKRNYECEFYPQNIRNRFTEPTTTLRSMPLEIDHPCHQIVRTEVILPEEWPVKEKDEHLRNVAAQLDVRRQVEKNVFRMEYDYQTRTNVVMPEAMPQYVKSVAQMKEALGYSLTWENLDRPKGGEDVHAADSKVNWKIIAIVGGVVILLGGLFAVAVIVGIIIYFSRRKRP